jgi:hypothetical protein
MAARSQQTCFPQYTQVMRDEVGRYPERIYQLTIAVLALPHQLEDSQPCRVSEGTQRCHQSVIVHRDLPWLHSMIPYYFHNCSNSS